MSRSNEIVNMDSDDRWVDSAVAEIAVITDSELAQWQLTEGFDGVLAQILSSDVQGGIRPWRRRRLSRRAGTLAIAAVVVASAGAAAAAVKGGRSQVCLALPGAPKMT
jgi:hypothetical protein